MQTVYNNTKKLSLVKNGLNQLTISWSLNENVQVAFFDTREHFRQLQEGFQRFEIIDVFESFVGIVIHGYGDIPEVDILRVDVAE